MLKKNLVFTCLVFSMAATTANAATVNATDSGWFDSTGFNTSNSFSNYIAGDWQYNPDIHDLPGDPRLVNTRNFFVFDLKDVVGTVTSATLRISSGSVGWDGIYSLYDVDSTIPDLRQGPPQFPSTPLKPAVYTDLGSGASYGSEALTTATLATEYIVDIDLTLDALASINAVNANGGCTPAPSVDCLWALGGTYTPDIYVGAFGFAFGSSGVGTRQLIYSTSPVPLPAAAWLFGSGLLGLIGMARRKKAA